MSKNYASHSCVSRVKSPVHSRFATYPDVSYRAHDVRVDVGSAPTGVERRHRTCGLPVNGRTLCQLSYEPIYFFCRALKLPIWFSVSGPSDYLHDPCVFTDSNRFDSVTGYFFTIVLCCEGHNLYRTLFESMVLCHVPKILL